MDLVRLGLERGEAARDAVEVMTSLLERYGQGGTGHDPAGAAGPKPYWSSFLVADRRDAFVIETSGNEYEVEQVEQTRAISNRTTIPSFDAAHRHPRQPVDALVDPRLDASRAVLADQPVSVPSIAAHLRSHDAGGANGWTVCMHAHDGAGRLVEATTSSMIAELHAGRPPHAWVLVGSPCEHEYTELEVTPQATAQAISLVT
jgi:hypothetical protein